MNRIFIIIFFLFCSSAVLAKESRPYKLSENSGERNYLLYRPSSFSNKIPAPLVIVLHGGFGSGSQAEQSYNWDAEAERSGFLVAYPDGIRRSWNAGGTCCGKANRDNIDDISFITHLIQTISKTENIDAARVYLTGISNGAALAYRYGCEGSYPIAAIGSVAGSFSFSCQKPHQTSVIEIHGLQDEHIPFAGGYGSKGVAKVLWQPVQRSVDSFRNVDNCQPPVIQKNQQVQTSISNCEKGRKVELVTIGDAGHQWPGSKSKSGLIANLLQLDQPSTALDATPTLWNFFKDQRN